MMTRIPLQVTGIAFGALALLVVSQGVWTPRAAVAQTIEPSCDAASDPNTPITVNAGDEFAIGLPANHTTGYAWQLDAEPDPAVAQLVTGVYVLPGPASTGPPSVGASGPPAVGGPGPAVGVGGRECWIFVAVDTGQTTLTLDYLRSFDPPGTPPAQSMSFSVVVQ